MKPTKTEVGLCRQIAEKYRKSIEYGDWFLNAWGKISCACGYAYPVHRPVRKEYENPKWIPLWTIEDCLEFLREKGYRGRLDEDEDVELINKTIGLDPFSVSCYGHKSKRSFFRYGKTPLEALLKAVLEVLNIA